MELDINITALGSGSSFLYRSLLSKVTKEEEEEKENIKQRRNGD
jgi:hypothetical protein